jgi:hypothetical protein
MAKVNTQAQVANSDTIKPSLMAFPKTWLWLALISIQILLTGTVFAQIIMAIMCVLPIVMVLMFATLGRSYTLDKNIITKTNHITGTTISIRVDDINGVRLKPNILGYGQVILTLVGGQTFKINNIKLPKHQEAVDSLLKNQTTGCLTTQGRHIHYQQC